jgi:hypothetical protein
MAHATSTQPGLPTAERSLSRALSNRPSPALGCRLCRRTTAPAHGPSGLCRRVRCLVARRDSHRLHAHGAGQRVGRCGLRLHDGPRRDERARAGPAPILLLLHVRVGVVPRRQDRVRDVALTALHRDIARRRRERQDPPADVVHAATRVDIVARVAARCQSGRALTASTPSRMLSSSSTCTERGSPEYEKMAMRSLERYLVEVDRGFSTSLRSPGSWREASTEFQLPLRREPIRSSVEQKGRSWASSHSSSSVCSLA